MFKKSFLLSVVAPCTCNPGVFLLPLSSSPLSPSLSVCVSLSFHVFLCLSLSLPCPPTRIKHRALYILGKYPTTECYPPLFEKFFITNGWIFQFIKYFDFTVNIKHPLWHCTLKKVKSSYYWIFYSYKWIDNWAIVIITMQVKGICEEKQWQWEEGLAEVVQINIYSRNLFPGNLPPTPTHTKILKRKICWRWSTRLSLSVNPLCVKFSYQHGPMRIVCVCI